MILFSAGTPNNVIPIVVDEFDQVLLSFYNKVVGRVLIRESFSPKGDLSYKWEIRSFSDLYGSVGLWIRGELAGDKCGEGETHVVSKWYEKLGLMLSPCQGAYLAIASRAVLRLIAYSPITRLRVRLVF